MESSPLHSTQVYSSPLKGAGGNGVHSSPVHSTQVQTSPLKGRGGMESSPVQSSPVHSSPYYRIKLYIILHCFLAEFENVILIQCITKTS